MIILQIMLMILSPCLAVHPDRSYLPTFDPHHLKNLFEPAISYYSNRIIRYPIPNPVIFPFLKSRDILKSTEERYKKLNSGLYTKEISTHYSHSKTTEESSVSDRRVTPETYEVVKVPVYSFAAYETNVQNTEDSNKESAPAGSGRISRVTAEDFVYGYSSKETRSGYIADDLKEVKPFIVGPDRDLSSKKAAENEYRNENLPTHFNEANKTRIKKPATPGLNRRYTSITGLKNQNLYTKIDVPGITPLLRTADITSPISTTSFKSPFVFYQYDIPREGSPVQINAVEQKNLVPGQRLHTKVSI